LIYTPIFDLECCRCGTSPVVSIGEELVGVRNTGLCGVCFFADRLMVDWSEWNQQPDSTE
jgi:NMD protein affecting ribosome stability and mRNA decay